MVDRTRVMIITDGFFMGTGFGEEMKNIGFRLAQSGLYDVYYLALQWYGYDLKFYDYQFEELPQKGAYITVLGNTGPPDLFGAPAFKRHYKKYTPDLVLFMGDPKNIRPYVDVPYLHKQKIGFPFMMYVTLDGDKLNPKYLDTLKHTDVMMAMTEWALNEYSKYNLPMGGYIHHGENTNFLVTNEKIKSELRRECGIKPSTTLFYNQEVNQHRKRLDALFRCWRDAHPETKDMKLFLNTDWDCRLGWHIPSLIKQYDVPRETVISPKDLFGEHKNWELSELPRHIRDCAMMADVTISTSSGEGFGKNNHQSLCFANPVITGNYTAMAEVLKKGAILVDPYEGRQGKFRWHDRSRAVEGYLINEEKFTEAILRLYDNPKERVELGLQGREYVVKNFDYDTSIFPSWMDVLEKVSPDQLFIKNVLKV